jgi:hypothetical protein
VTVTFSCAFEGEGANCVTGIANPKEDTVRMVWPQLDLAALIGLGDAFQSWRKPAKSVTPRSREVANRYVSGWLSRRIEDL